MKHAGWIAGAGILGSLLLVLITVQSIEGPEWAMYVVGTVLGLAWIAVAMWIAKWADWHIDQQRELAARQAEREAEEQEAARLNTLYPDTRVEAFWIAKAEMDARAATDRGEREI